MASQDRTVLVLYGSETGNAQDMAEDVGKMCQRLHFHVDVEEMDAAELSTLLRYQLVVFVVSTTGQGDMPHNALLFWKKLLRKKLPPGCLSSLRYTCFGLGDSTYLKFNWAARKLIRRLDQLGATTFIEGFEADEQFPDGIDGSFVRWADGLSKHLLEHYPPPDGQDPIPEDAILPPRWTLEPALAKLKTNSQTTNGNSSPPPPPLISGPPPDDLLSIPNSWTATMASNKRQTPSTHWQDVRLVSFDIPPRPSSSSPSEPLHCNPGDCLTIYPKNFPQDVDKLITLMNWTSIADKPLDLSLCWPLPRNLNIPPPPAPTTIRSVLLNNVDITAIPRRSFLKSMSYFCTDPDHKERLLEFNMAEYIDEYFDYATRSRRTIIEVLEEFTSVQIPASRILDIFPLIRGRDFSIANGGSQLSSSSSSSSSSSPSPDTTRVDLLIALVRYRTVLRKPRQGLCSRYLADMAPGTQLNVTVKRVLSPIHGALNAQRPLIAMATGTGIAPVRCLIHERMTHSSSSSSSSSAPTLLFFGNRNRDADYFFSEEWESLANNNSSGKLLVFPAFSRDQREKIYVQDLIRREKTRLAELIPQKPIFAVCGGSSKMADACKAAVFDPFIEGVEGEEGEVERKRMLDAVTWWQEIW